MYPGNHIWLQNQKELLALVTSIFCSIMYYNSEIWHIPILKATLKQKLLSASAKALRVCTSYVDYGQSFMNLHKMCNRATPESIKKYTLALSLHKLYNKDFNIIEFVHLNQNQILISRQTMFKTLKSNVFKVGMNSLTNRLTHINDFIPFTWLNMSIDTFKVHCQKLFFWFSDCKNWFNPIDNSPYGPFNVLNVI